MRLLWLPEVLRAAGLTVHEHSGWRTRGSADWGPVRGITCHATAGSRTSTDAGELRTIVNGSATAPPPIAQLYLSRSGQWWVVASGRCNHNKTGWDGPNEGLGNSNLIGIEAQHSNTTAEPWPDVQYRSYVRGVAALAERLGIPVARVAGHKEHQPYATRPPGEGSTKSDPTFNMDQFRRDVTAVLAGEADEMDAGQAYVQHVMNYRLEAVRANREQINIPASGGNPATSEKNELALALKQLGQRLAAIEARPPVQPAPVDVTALAAALKPELLAEIRDAVADLGEGGAAQVRAGSE